MSEKIYAWLLRLYPSYFRRAYGEAALQLFRDRSRDERGVFTGLRLWLDLISDLAVSAPREYRRAQGGRSSARQHRRVWTARHCSIFWRTVRSVSKRSLAEVWCRW